MGSSWTAHVWALAVVLVSSQASCIIAGDKCGPHQVEIQGYHSFCACEPGWVVSADGRGCTACGEDEVVVSDACACKPGFVRSKPGAACEEASIGASCAADTPCTEPYPYCVQPDPATAGYCTTSGCATQSDCPGGWSCEISGSTRFCRRPPSGIGASCQSNDDCAGFDAKYCEAFATHTCLLSGCAERQVSCPSEWACCDYSALLGSALSICVSSDGLVAGACPRGGNRVSP